MTFNLESLVLSVSRLISLITSSPGLSSAVLFRGQWCFVVGEGKRVEYNGLRGGLVSANKEHGRTSFQSTRSGGSTG